MPTLNIKKNININAKKDAIKKIVTDLTQRQWSPWFIMEPECKTKNSGTEGKVGHTNKWDGEIIGAGEMTITDIQENKVEFDLLFLKPFKSKAKIYFEFEEKQNTTNVSWVMDSSLPWFMFFFKKTMTNMIGMDYDRGLKMLKEYTEDNRVSSNMTLNENDNIKDMDYIGLDNECSMENIGNVMQKDFKILMEFARKNNIEKDAVYFSIYHNFDMSKNIMSFSSALQIKKDIQIKSPFIKSQIKQSKAIKVRHIGKYDYLGNAWSFVMMYARNKKIKTNKKPMGYEFYINNPTDINNCDKKIDEDKMITDVYVGLK